MPDILAREDDIDRPPDRPASAGDAFENIVARHMHQVMRIAYQITKSVDDARDVAQFAFMQLHLKGSGLTDERSMTRWLYVVTRNEALNVYERRRRDDAAVARSSEGGPLPGLEEIVLRKERSEQVRATIATLPAAHRHLIEMRHLVSMPTSEIAAQLGVPEQRVRRDVERAKFRLRVEMQRRGLDRDVG